VITLDDGVVRLDDAGVAALLRGEGAGLGPALETLRRPLVTVEVLVAGSSLERHRVWVDADQAVVLLAVRPGLHQLMVLPPSHLAAALVRMTRTGPRRARAHERSAAPTEAAPRLVSADDGVRQQALQEAGATLAWRLRVGWAGEHRDLVAVDGPDGLRVLDDEAGALLPASATMLYRVFSTVLTPGMLEQRA
jgi:hypothetical protein